MKRADCSVQSHQARDSSVKAGVLCERIYVTVLRLCPPAGGEKRVVGKSVPCSRAGFMYLAFFPQNPERRPGLQSG